MQIAFGYRFWYWSLSGQKHRRQFNYYQYWYIPRKYLNLKKEILNVLNIEQFNSTCLKATKYLQQSDIIKIMQSDDDHGLYPYNIDNKTPLSTQNIMSILFYCGFLYYVQNLVNHLENYQNQNQMQV